MQRPRDRLSTGTHTAHKDLSLILIPKWSGSESVVPLEEFTSSIKVSAKIGRWQDSDCVQIADLKLTDLTKSFYNACQELHAEDTTRTKFKQVFRLRFKDIRPDQYYYLRILTARKGRNEDPEAFPERCLAQAQIIMCKVSDPQAQQIHRENNEGILLASFMAGLGGTPGKQTRHANPQTIQQALTISLSLL